MLLFLKIIKEAGREKQGNREKQGSQFPGCIKGRGAPGGDGVLHVAHHRGDVRVGNRMHAPEEILLPEDVVAAIVLLQLRGQVVQDNLLFLVPALACACDIWDTREREGQVPGAGCARKAAGRTDGCAWPFLIVLLRAFLVAFC